MIATGFARRAFASALRRVGEEALEYQGAQARSVQGVRNSYNVIAEIPGRDPAPRDDAVLIGGHIDSWHKANGPTDTADGAVFQDSFDDQVADRAASRRCGELSR